MALAPAHLPAAALLSTSAVVVNFVLFQLGWFACILGAAHGWPWAGTLAVAAVVAWHVLRAPRPVEELKLVGAALAIGLVWENLLMHLGLVQFASGQTFDALAPVWILAMWALFATVLNVSLRWLKGRWLLAVVLGAVAGPASYYGGVRMGAATLPQLVPALVALSIGWAVLTPLLLLAAQRWNGMQAQAPRV
jgi:hypothetical protein